MKNEMTTHPNLHDLDLDQLADEYNESEGIISLAKKDANLYQGKILLEARERFTDKKTGNRDDTAYGKWRSTNFVDQKPATLAIQTNLAEFFTDDHPLGDIQLSIGYQIAAPKSAEYAEELYDEVFKLSAAAAEIKSERGIAGKYSMAEFRDIESKYLPEKVLATRKKKATVVQMSQLNEKLVMLVRPELMVGLSEFGRRAIFEEHAEITALLDKTGQKMSKETMNLFVKLLKYHTTFFRSELELMQPSYITDKVESLDEREKGIDKQLAALKVREKKAAEILDDKEIKRINQCLAPDRAPGDRHAMFEKAFQSFQKLQ